MNKHNVYFFETDQKEIFTFANSAAEARKAVLSSYPTAREYVGLHGDDIKYWQHELETSNFVGATTNDCDLMIALLKKSW
jgi:hypothetical protein